MKIQEIVLDNIGPYIGENKIKFNIDDTSKNIILIGGRNGAGKTTLFDAMKLCLYGYKLYGYRQNSQVYTAKIKKLMNDTIKRTATPQAGVHLSIFIEDGYSKHTYTVSRQWELRKNQIKEIYSVHKDGNKIDEDEQIDFENYLLQTIPPALFNFHFFNGENITEFLFDKENGQSFKKAFMQICGLDTLDLIQDQLHNNIRVHSDDFSASTQEDYYEKKAQLTATNAKGNELSDNIKAINIQIRQLEEEHALLEQQMTQFGGIQSDEWQEIQGKIRTEESLREDAHKYLKECANNILPFLILKRELVALQEQIQLEANIQSNRTIKERLFKNETKGLLQSGLEPYLNNSVEDFTNDFLHTLYDIVKYDCSESPEFLKLSEQERIYLLSKVSEYLSFDEAAIINAERNVEKSLSRTKRLRKKSESTEVLTSENYFGKKSDLLSQIDNLRKQFVDLALTKSKVEEELKGQIQDFEKVSIKFKAILKEKSVNDISARALLAFNDLREILYKKYITQVEDAFLRNFNALLTKSNFLDGIYISEQFEVIPYKYTIVDTSSVRAFIESNGVDYAVDHFGERAFHILQNNLDLEQQIEVPIKIEQHFSAGEQQIYVMALYQALSEIRSSEIPFVIDTPLARIDSTHRRNILNNFFSRLPGQVIILSTDEEIDAPGVSALKPKLSDLYLLENLAGSGTTVVRNQYFKEALD